MKPQIQDDMSVAQADPEPGGTGATLTPNARHTYLVVSMGFWPKFPDKDFLYRVATTIPATDLVAAIHPDSVLPHARRYAAQCDTVINIDCHAGIGGGEEIIFEDGQKDCRRFELSARTWGDYLTPDSKKAFIWGHPNAEHAHRVECRADIFNDPADLPFERITQKYNCAWETLKHYTAKPPHYGVDLAAVRAAAFVVAPGRCSPGALRELLSIVKEYSLKLLDWDRAACSDRWLFNEIERGGTTT